MGSKYNSDREMPKYNSKIQTVTCLPPQILKWQLLKFRLGTYVIPQTGPQKTTVLMASWLLCCTHTSDKLSRENLKNLNTIRVRKVTEIYYATLMYCPRKNIHTFPLEFLLLLCNSFCCFRFLFSFCFPSETSQNSSFD